MKWVIGLILMALYQYWVYSSFWINTDDVAKVGQAKHISGEIVGMDCWDIKKDRGVFRQKIYIQLDGKPEFYFFDPSGVNFFQLCNDFLVFFNELSLKPEIKVTDTQENLLAGTPVMFDGYFWGRSPLKVTVNGHILYSFKHTKAGHTFLVFWLSLTPVICVLGIFLVRWYKKGGLEKLGQQPAPLFSKSKKMNLRT
jgi:hypothetical protein